MIDARSLAAKKIEREAKFSPDSIIALRPRRALDFRMSLSSAALASLFPPEAFAFRLTLQRSALPDFFAAADPIALDERSRLLAAEPSRYSALEPEAVAPLEEFARLASAWLHPPLLPMADAGATLRCLGGRLEPDFVFLTRDGSGAFRLRGGVVCFPSWWDLGEKVNHTLAEIHGPVPGLNDALAPAIDRFLDRLKPGTAVARSNWGLAATPALCLHPQAGQPRLGATLEVTQTWLRVEEQILAALPETNAIVFGIRIRLEPLTRVLAEPAARRGFHRAVATMPDALTAYKGFGGLRPALVDISA